MSWKERLEMELEVAAMDALDGGPATPSAAAAAERNMRAVLERWLKNGQMPGIKAYHLSVSGGRGLNVSLDFEEETLVREVNVKTDPV